MQSQSLLSALLMEAFPAWRALAPQCWVYQAIDQNQEDLGDVIDCVSLADARGDFVQRLKDEHPVDKTHHDQHDTRLLDVFTEGEALAWAFDVAKLGQPHFVKSEGAPDLAVGDDSWIEAKTVHNSQEEKQFQDDVVYPALARTGMVMRGPTTLVGPAVGYIGKFKVHLDDALLKWQRQNNSGQLIVFFHMNIDFGISPRAARREVVAWATSAEAQTGAGIVICDGYTRWRTPLYQRGTVTLS